MSYYWFNRKELLKKAKEKYHNYVGKEGAAEYYIANKEVLNKMQAIIIEKCQKKTKK